jgi:hypothetical protein
MRHLEVQVTDAGVVGSKAGHGNVSFAIVETCGSDRVGWQEEQNNHRPESGYATCKEIHILPWVQRASCDMAKTVVDDWRDDGDIT